MSVDLLVHGIRVRIAGPDPAVLESLAGLFLGFEAAPAGHPHVEVELREGRRPPALERRMVADQVVERGLVYNRGDTVFVDHHGVSGSVYDYAAERGTIYAEEPADFVEQGYLMIHSRLGPHLERRGFVRLHACGFVVDGQAGLALAPSGGGKSRLAVALLRHDPSVSLLGDDMVLLDRLGRALPFPHPIGVSDPSVGEGLGEVRRFQRRAHGDKWLIGGAPLLARHAAGRFPVAMVALLTRASAPPTKLTEAPPGALWAALWRDAVVGLGLPQVIEMVARRGAQDLVAMTPSVLRRARSAAALASRAQARRLESHDPSEAAGLLLDGLRRCASAPNG
ncbi:MAG: hypothetical protein H6719_18950 [Sandaracinaceae bacterium]|nr:hypothetical protein [Sandaracinaceae bacterium]